MRITARLELFLLILAAMLFVVSCAPSIVATLPSTPESTISITAAPTATPTATPTAEPTPVVDEYGFTDERKAELDQQIQDFLNYQGEYSKENIQNYLLPASGFNKDKFYNLGVVSSREITTRVQVWLFDYIEKDNDLLLITGFDGKDNKRFVTTLNIPLHLKKLNSKIGVAFIELYGWGNNVGESSAGRSGDLDTIKSHLFKNSPTMLLFLKNTDDGVEINGVDNDTILDVGQYYNHNIPYVNDLLSQIDQNGNEIVGALKIGNERIQKIETVSDIFGLNNANIPIVDVIVFVGA